MKQDKERIAKMESVLAQAEKDLEFLKSLKVTLERITTNSNMLSAYYNTEWLEDYESNTDHISPLLNQDSVWNVLQEQYAERVSILKILINSIDT